MLKIKIIAEVELYATQKELPEVAKNAMKTLRQKFEDEEGKLKIVPDVKTGLDNGGLVIIKLRSEGE